MFTALGIGATLVGSLFLRNQDTVVRVFGVVIVAMGLVTMGALRVPVLMRERRVDLSRVPRGPAYAFPLGMAFAAGWAPCVGPGAGHHRGHRFGHRHRGLGWGPSRPVLDGTGHPLCAVGPGPPPGFVSGRQGAARSSDGGRTWATLSLPEGASLVEADPAEANVLYAGVHDGSDVRVLVSRDGGLRWDRP